MTRKAAEKRAAELSRLLREYQRAYFVESRPLVSDSAYDALFDELRAIEQAHPDSRFRAVVAQGDKIIA